MRGRENEVTGRVQLSTGMRVVREAGVLTGACQMIPGVRLWRKESISHAIISRCR